MKKLFLILIVILFASRLFAADKNLAWDASSMATGYKIYMSIDNGATWITPIDVGNVVTTVYPNVPDDKLILFKVSAYNAVGETITHWQGAWYDGRLRPPNSTVGLGVK